MDRIARGFVYRRSDLDDTLGYMYGYDLMSVCVYNDEALSRRERIYDLKLRLSLFFSIHSPEMITNVGLIARSFVHEQNELNRALMLRYECDVRC